MPALRQLVADVFRVDPDAVGPADSPETIPAWDSLQHFALVLELEERFGIQLETEEIEKLTTVGDIQRLLDVHGVGSAGEGGTA